MAKIEGEHVPENVLIYLNRLSDFLFVLARDLNARAGVDDVPMERVDAMNLQGKVALITGGKRVGGALATMLAERGANVAMTYHTSREAIERTVASVESCGVRGLAVGADLSKAGQAERAVAQVVEKLGRIDILVNMASTYRLMPFDSLTPSRLRRDDRHEPRRALFHVDLRRPGDARAKRTRTASKGRSSASVTGRPNGRGEACCPTSRPKGGLTTLTLALAKELAPHITVNLIQPSTIDPPPGTTEAEIQKTVDLTPLHRIGTPDDANRLILYLLEGTDYATGGVYRIDGGRYLGMDSQDL